MADGGRVSIGSVSRFRKVFHRLGLNVPEKVMRGICLGQTGLVEVFLYNLRTKIDECVRR
jgi:hypothetical protein